MQRGRQQVAGLGTAVVHAGLWIWAVTRPTPEPPSPPPTPIEIVKLQPTAAVRAPLAPTPMRRAGAVTTAEPELEPKTEQTPEPEPVRPSPAPRPEAPSPSPPPQPEPTIPVDPEPASAPGQEPPPVSLPEPRPSGTGTQSDAEPNDAGAQPAASTPRPGLGGEGGADFKAYGAEIVRIVMAEIDRDPVPGIFERDTIELVLRVRPDGRLVWVGQGRYDFVQVRATSVGRSKTRRLLRRVLRASKRFPAHPSGFRRKYYEIAFRVNFRDHA
ncbi:MAG: hypothetical protein K0V04_30305 [Deltaproteobacteria bacterium]|nr:hypothetical protein [Deltaproteobacteria bacterium]